MNLNKALIIGRVTGDVEMRTTPSGINVATLSVATNRVYKDAAGNKKENVEFHNVVLWRRLAEIANQYLSKGQMVFIEGHLQTRNWEGKDGVKRYRTEIVGDNMQLGPRPGNSQSPNTGAMSENTPPPPDDSADSAESTPPPPSSNKPSQGEDDIKVEDIPF